MRDEEDEEEHRADHWAWRDLEDRVCMSWMTEEDAQDRWAEVPAEELVAKVGNVTKDFPHRSWRDVDGRICLSWRAEEDAVTGPRWKEVPTPPLLDKVGNVIKDIHHARYAYHHGFLGLQEDGTENDDKDDEEEVSEDEEEEDNMPLRWHYLRDKRSAVSSRVKKLLDLAAEDSDDDAEDDDEQNEGMLSDQGKT
jgi:hypothetical protein